MVEVPFACVVQVTGTVRHVVHPTLPGEACASSVASPSESLTSLLCRPCPPYLPCHASVVCLQCLQLGHVCGCGDLLCAECVCLMQNGMVRLLLQPALLTILVCTCFSLCFLLSWCATIAAGLAGALLEAAQEHQVQAEAQAGCLTTSRRSPPGSMLMRPVPAAALQHPHGIPGPAWGQISPSRSLRVLPEQLTEMPQGGADHRGGQSGREGVRP